jgi:4-amino-4-deoxy-L-arabinose transferase-like glycosyltransferase
MHLGYGYFCDELHCMVCGQYLASGYMDHGPIVAIQARLSSTLFGRNIVGIRALSSGAGAARIFLTGILTWALGGRRSAQAIAILAVLCVPIYLGIDGS